MLLHNNNIKNLVTNAGSTDHALILQTIKFNISIQVGSNDTDTAITDQIYQ
jgi:hypothetical protein